MILLRMYNLFIVSFLVALGLCCCAQVFSSCGKRRLAFTVVHGLLIEVASLVERRLQTHRLQQLQHAGSVVAVCGLSCLAACGVLVHLPAIELGSSSLQDGFLTTGPPRKFENCLLFKVALLKYSSYTIQFIYVKCTVQQFLAFHELV